VVFDPRGFPIFDDVAAFETRLPQSVASVMKRRRTHFEAATRDLADSIRRGQVPGSQFTSEQLRAIMAGRAKIPGFTWHHHQQFGRMQSGT
jgi:hypothetical protein